MLLRALLTLAWVLVGAAALPAAAQQSFILVIDGSSSMWGQVDGEAKIDILKSSLSGVLGQLDTGADVGIVAFGHREKGNCADIELLVPPQPFDAELLEAAIATIEPKGKTPLSDAVRFAAEELRFTEERATVVILGDGGENCGMDPCAVAEDLERTGVDLTVHAIAFDIADDEGSAQLQCFASATGGLFLPVADAPELVTALETVQEAVATPEPEPEPVAVTFEATDAESGGALDLTLDWEITGPGGEAVEAAQDRAGPLEIALEPGDYIARVSGEGASAEVPFSVAGGVPARVEVPIALPRVRLLPSDAATGQPVAGTLSWTFTDLATGVPIRLEAAAGELSRLVPPGEYEVTAEAAGALGEARVAVAATGTTDVALALAAPATTLKLTAIDAATGVPVPGAPVNWTFVDVASESVVEIEGILNEGLSEAVPPGTYDVIAEAGGGYGEAQVTVSAGGTAEVVVLLAMPEAPFQVEGSSFTAGSAVPVRWTFEGQPSDLVFLLPSAEADNRYPLDDERRHVVGETRSATLTAPALPGVYDVRYFSPEAGGLVHRVQVAILSAEGRIAGPESGFAGEEVEVKWKGPDQPGDFVFVAPYDWADDAYPLSEGDRVPVAGVNRATLVLPAQEGSYEYRYYSLGGGGVLFRASVQVGLRGARVTAPTTVEAGSAFRVDFTGPQDAEDRLFVVAAGSDPDRYPLADETGEAVQGGSPATLVAPVDPGVYEVRYFNPEKGGVLASTALTVTDPVVAIDAPRLVQRASNLRISVRGPMAPGDIVFIAPSDWADNAYPLGDDDQLSFGEGVDAVPAAGGVQVFETVAPAQPGAYEIRYFSWANGDVLYRRAIVVR